MNDIYSAGLATFQPLCSLLLDIKRVVIPDLANRVSDYLPNPNGRVQGCCRICPRMRSVTPPVPADRVSN